MHQKAAPHGKFLEIVFTPVLNEMKTHVMRAPRVTEPGAVHMQ